MNKVSLNNNIDSKKGLDYDPEVYWSEVATRTAAREDGIIAGDDEPYYRYKREKFLHILRAINFKNKKVLEIGSGPGGNLMEVWQKKPQVLNGVDISQNMVDYSSSITPKEIEIHKINGTDILFEERAFDIVFSVTVLQHNTDPGMLEKLMESMCRVSDKKVILFERIESRIKGDELNLGRPVEYYSQIMNNNGFELSDLEYLHIHWSYLVCGSIRKVLNSKNRKEGEPLNWISNVLQKISLPITKRLDDVVKVKRDLAKLEFVRKA